MSDESAFSTHHMKSQFHCRPYFQLTNWAQEESSLANTRSGIHSECRCPCSKRLNQLGSPNHATNTSTNQFTSELDGVIGVEEAIKVQREKLRTLREKVRKLSFKKIDIAGNYASIAYKAFDGGKMGIKFNPFEVNVVDVADSNGKRKIRFVVPEITGYADDDKVLEEVLDRLDEIPEIKRLVQLLKQKTIRDVSYLLKDSNNLMEIAEWACIFDRLTAGSRLLPPQGRSRGDDSCHALNGIAR